MFALLNDDTQNLVEIATWFGIGLCLLHSAMFSGLNLALFCLSRMQLEIESEQGSPEAHTILELRKDGNFLLTTILWGNVGVNTLLTLLMDSVLFGVAAFAFSTFGITFVGEIIPQAYFSRNALKMGARLAPVLRFYQKLFWIVAKPSAKLLDAWLGADGTQYFREQHLRAGMEEHMHAEEADLGHQEGAGALNFLSLDDLPVMAEGELVDPKSVISLPCRVDLPTIPEFACDSKDPFVAAVMLSERKWVILTDEDEEPQLVLDADAFLRAVLSQTSALDAYQFCHRPIVTRDPSVAIGTLLRRFEVEPEHDEDDVIDRDILLLWGEERRVITGADLLGRLLRGIATDPTAKMPRHEPYKDSIPEVLPE